MQKHPPSERQRKKDRKADRKSSRRAYLSQSAAVLTATTVAIPGCQGLTGELSDSRVGKTSNSPIQGWTVAGPHLTVQLASNQDANRVTLASSNGEKFVSEELVPGVSTVRLKLLDITPNRSQHYDVGSNRLIVDTKQDTFEKTVNLIPELGIVDAQIYQERSDRGVKNVSLTLQNTGTAPTWLYDLFFEDSPNEFAETAGGQPGSPALSFKKPNSPGNVILAPNSKQQFVGVHDPFIFSNKSRCEQGTVDVVAKLKVATGEILRQRLTFRPEGEAVPVNSGGIESEYACSKGTVTLSTNAE